MVMDRVRDAIYQHQRKMEWQAEEEARKRIPMSSKEKYYQVYPSTSSPPPSGNPAITY